MKRITKKQTKTVGIRVPLDLANEWKEVADKKGISLSDHVWSLINGKRGLTPEQERFLVKAFLLVNSMAHDIHFDGLSSEDQKIVDLTKRWALVDDSFRELLVSLFGDDAMYGNAELPEQKAVDEEIQSELRDF